MGLDGPVANAVLDHDGTKVELHGVHDACAYAAAGSAPHNDSGVNTTQMKPLRQTGRKKCRGRGLA